MRTIAARIRNTKTELDDLGEVMTEANYEELVSTLTDAGVRLTDINGEYRSTYDIMADIAAKWDEMNSMQQAAMATALSGTRQQAVFYSIIENFQEASKSMESMTNSSGALQEAFSDYMNTAKAHIQNFKNAFAALATSVFDSGLLKFFIDIATAVVNGISTVTDWIKNLGGLKTILLGVASALLLVKGGLIAYKVQMIAVAAWQKILTFFTAIKNGIMNIVNIIPNAIVAWKAYAAGTATASTALQASIPVIGLVLAALTALTAGMALASSQTNDSADDMSDKMDETNRKAKELAQTAKTETEELSKLSVEYINAANQLDGLTGTTNKYVTATDNLRKGLKIEQSEIQSLIDKYGDYDTALRNASLSKLKASEIDLRAGVDAAGNDLQDAHTTDVVGAYGSYGISFENLADNVRQQFIDAGKELDNLPPELEFHFTIAPIPDDVDETTGEIKSFVDGALITVGNASQEMVDAYGRQNAEIIHQYQAYKAALELLQDTVGADNPLYQEILKNYQEIQEPAEAFLNAVNALNENLVTQYLLENDIGKTVPKTAEEFEAFREKLISAAIASGEFYGTQDDIKRAIDNVLSSSSDYAQFYNNVTSAIEKFESRAEKLNEELDKLQDAFSSIKTLQDNYNTNGFFSTDDLQKLLSLTPEYLNLLVDENGQLDLTSESYKKYIAIKAKALVLDQVKALYESILSMSAEEAQAYANAAAYDEQADSLEDLIVATTKYYAMLAQQKDLESNSTVYTDALKKSLSTVSLYASVYDSWLNSLNSSTNEFTDKTEENTDALKKQKQALENQKKALEDSKKALEDYKSDLSDAQSAIKSLIDAVTDYIKQQKEDEKSALQERKDAFDELIEKEKEELAAKKESAKFDEELAKKQSTVAKNALAASIASLDDSAAGRKAQKQANDALISSQDDLRDTLADHEYDIRVKALDKLKEASDKYYDDEIKKIDEYLSDGRKLYEDACRTIDNDTGDLYGKLWAYTYKYTSKTRAEFDELWSKAKAGLDKYNAAQIGVMGVMELLQSSIYTTKDQIDKISEAIDGVSDSIQALADNSLKQVQSRISGIKDEYDKLMKLMSIPQPPPDAQSSYQTFYGGYYYKLRGVTFSSTKSNREEAVADIISQVRQKFGQSVDVSPVKFEVKQYASGTTSASGGASIVGERGAELRMLNRGDGIVTAGATKGLEALGNLVGSNPLQFIKEAGQAFMRNILGSNMRPAFEEIGNTNQISPSISIVIQGDATQSTVNALKSVADDIVNRATRNVMSVALRNKRMI